MDRAEIAVLIGYSLCVFAVGVVFSQFGAAIFAAYVSSTIVEAAIGWFLLGAVILAVGVSNIAE